MCVRKYINEVKETSTLARVKDKLLRKKKILTKPMFGIWPNRREQTG